jgi:hypothetical protein
VFEPDAQDLVAAGRVKGVGRIPGPAGDGIAVDAGVVLDANQDRVVTFADPALLLVLLLDAIRVLAGGKQRRDIVTCYLRDALLRLALRWKRRQKGELPVSCILRGLMLVFEGGNVR